jgi:hypothetical protein
MANFSVYTNGRIMIRKILFISAAAIVAACATPAMLPQSNADVDYSATGFVKGSGWHDGAVYDASEEEMVAAIRSAFLANGLQIQEFSREDRRFVAESPMNLQRWASYVAVYFRPIGGKRTEVHVVSIGTKDINILAGDAVMPLPPKIVASISSSLSRKR